MNYYLGGQGSEGQSGPGAVGAVGAGVPGVGVGLGGSLGSHSHSHATSQQQQQQQVQQQQYLMQQHYAAYQAQAHAQANANANQAYQPTTNQERINDVTMTIENPNVVGSGYIRHPPQRRFQGKIIQQPLTCAVDYDVNGQSREA